MFIKKGVQRNVENGVQNMVEEFRVENSLTHVFKPRLKLHLILTLRSMRRFSTINVSILTSLLTVYAEQTDVGSVFFPLPPSIKSYVREFLYYGAPIIFYPFFRSGLVIEERNGDEKIN